MTSIIAAHGEVEAEKWAQGLVDNLARRPQGNDRAQVKAIYEGECDIAIINNYYFGKLKFSEDPKQREWIKNLLLIFPNQDNGDRGAHINISGGGVAKFSKNKESAIALLEFLTNPKAQKLYGEINFEYPANLKIEPGDELKSWGNFREDNLPIIKIAELKDMEKNIVEQTRARHILVKTNQYTTDDYAREKLRQLKIRIINGDDFGLLAKGNSDDSMSAINGGELGWRTKGELVIEFQNTLDNLTFNEISEPFKTQFGWHIAQVLERRDHDNSENLKRAKVRNVIGDRKLNEALQNWNTQLLDEAYVEYRLDDV